MNLDPSQIARTLADAIGFSLPPITICLLHRQGSGRYRELDGARSRQIPILARIDNRSWRRSRAGTKLNHGKPERARNFANKWPVQNSTSSRCKKGEGTRWHM